MIQTNQRSSFCHSISLNHGESQSIPESLHLLRECGSARNEGPEFPAETRMDPAEPPPAAKKVLAVCRREIPPKLIYFPIAFHITFDLTFERFNETRNRDKDGDPLSPDRVHEVRRPEGVEENNSARKHRRNEQSEHLAKDMTERKQVQEAQRMNKLFMPEVLLDFALQSLDVGEHIAVRNHNATRLSSGARGKNDF